MTIPAISRQALFEQLHELETKYAVQFSRGATLYINPTNSFGEDVTPRLPGGYELEDPLQHRAVPQRGGRGAAVRIGPSMIKQPHYIDLEEARQVLAEMGVALSPRQMKRAADIDARGRRKLPFFLDPIEGKLKIEKNTLRGIYMKAQATAENNLRK